MTTLTEVDVTSDLKYAKIKVSVYDSDDAKRKSSVDALNHAAGFISHELGARMRIRAVPSLKFALDNSIAYSVRISEISTICIRTKGRSDAPCCRTPSAFCGRTMIFC